jgi:poly(A) polymerase
MTKITALMKFLSQAATRLGVASHTYIVGGAVRNFLLDLPPKDVDVVIDTVALGGKKDSSWFAKQLQRFIPAQTNLTENQYGVAILTISGAWLLEGHSMQGEVIEIANARKESYGDPSGKGYKPHMVEPATIEEDLLRRDFSVNTLMWKLLDLEHGPERAEVLDLLGVGRKHLEEGVLQTPLNPDRTFSDDPTRMLRAIRFCIKYNLKIPPEMAESIRRNAPKLKNVPWNAVLVLVQSLLEM